VNTFKIGYLITARLKSTRLPQKLLKSINGKPLIEIMVDQIRQIPSAEKIIVCTSTNPEDDRLASFCSEAGILCHRGSEEDVLARLEEAATQHHLDGVLNCTADCPLIDPDYAEAVAQRLILGQADLIRCFDLPHGAFTYGIRTSALRKAVDIKASPNTEAWGPYFTDTIHFNIEDIPITNSHQRPEIRLTVDYAEDFELVSAVIKGTKRKEGAYRIGDVIAFLDSNQKLMQLNAAQVEAYQKRYLQQSKIDLIPFREVSTALLIGMGSIGLRHAQNLLGLGIPKLLALRSGKSLSKDPIPFECECIYDLQEAQARKPDIVIISNPTSLHRKSIEDFLPHTQAIFIEKPIDTSLDFLKPLANRAINSEVLTYVGYNLQFHPVIRKIESLLKDDVIGVPLSFQAQVGHWLPNWHPEEDFRDGYAARKDLGGGVTLTLAHEIHLACALFGDVERVVGVQPKHESLLLDVDVRSDFMLQHRLGAISQIHLDFVQNPLTRSGIIIGTEGTIQYDLAKKSMNLSTNTLTELYDFSEEEPNVTYIREMKDFLELYRQGRKRHGLDFWQALHTQGVIDALSRSIPSEKWENVPEWTKPKGIGSSIGVYR